MKSWDFSRYLRLGIGVVLGISGIVSQEYWLLFLAGFLILQAVFNVSCCGAGGCAGNESERKIYKDEIIDYKKREK